MGSGPISWRGSNSLGRSRATLNNNNLNNIQYDINNNNKYARD